MVYILDNFLPILAATAAGFVFGLAWHALFSRNHAGGWRHVVVFGLEFWIACILAGAIILAPPEAGAWTMAIGSAVVIWIGFVAPTIAASGLYAVRPGKAMAVDAGHWLGVFLVQVAILQAWGLVAPASA